MKISTNQIVSILQLKGLGRKTALKILDLSNDFSIDSNSDLTDFILEIFNNKYIPRIPDYTKFDILDAFNKGQDILEKSDREGIKIISVLDENYPSLLKEIPDKPIVLNYKGNLSILEKNIGIAIIGTREPSLDGIKIGEYVSSYFSSHNFNIISGLAKGCDTAGHKGALQSKGLTTAIVAHGLHTIYPKENKKLSEDILSNNGLLISEYFIGVGALANFFVERDRLQSGLSLATIVIQTDIKGGTMHAVNATIESKKLLAAIKFKEEHLGYDKTRGNELLIKEGKAFPLTSSNIEEFRQLIISKSNPNRMSLPNLKEDVLNKSINTDKSNTNKNDNSKQLNLFD